MVEIKNSGDKIKIQKLLTQEKMRDSSFQKEVSKHKNHSIFDYDSLSWLSNNYIKKYGLRRWTWRKIINGIIKEQILYTADQEDSIEYQHVKLVWMTFLKVQDIDDLDQVPNVSDPNHKDVKAILFLYSLDSFLYHRLNQISRKKDASAIWTLGAYSVALTRVIEKV